MSSTQTPNYLDPHVLERIKRLDVRARRVVEGFITGQHRSPYNGFAIEFAGHREYAPGDELKHIDWKVWSKTDRLYIKEYEEETNLKATMVVDASKSMAYGSLKNWSKFDCSATAAAALSHLLQQQQDSVGLVTFNTKVDKVFPPSSRRNHLKQIVQALEDMEPTDKTDVGEAFLELAQQVKKRGIIAFFTDALVDVDVFKKALEQFRVRRHEVIVFHVMDDDEINFPFDENTRFLGMESVDEVQADPRALRKTYMEIVGKYLKDIRKACDGMGVDYALVNTKEPLDAVLARYLAFRKAKTRRARGV